MGRAPCCDKVGLNRGKWTKEEDEILANYIKFHGEGSWRSLPKKAGLLRCGKSCRLRWINYLRAGLKRGCFSREEDELIIKLHTTLGNRWSLIANELPGRTDNDIKNYWNSHLSRSIDCYHVIRDGNTKAEPVEPLKNSKKNNQKSSTKIARPPKKIMKRKTVHKPLNHQKSSQDCSNKIQCEFSSFSDEALWNSNDDFLNDPFSPIILDNLQSCTLDPIKTDSEFSCTTEEPCTSKEEITNEPGSPDLSSIFKEIDNLLCSEVKERNEEHGDYNGDYKNMLGDIENEEIGVGMEEESRFWDFGCTDFLWDLDLWSICGRP